MNIPKRTLDDSSHTGPALAVRGDEVLLGWVGPENRKLNFGLTSDGRTLFGSVASSRDLAPRPEPDRLPRQVRGCLDR